jgi:TonB family protein
MKAVHAIVVVGIVLAAAAAGPRAQDPLSAAKDQYASAAYEDALSTLSRVDGAASGVARQVDEYRAFCLYALGRTREAESIAESMIRREPLARLDAADASPRLESMFAEVRKRLLPSLIRDRFRVARAALEQKSLSGAEPQLTEARLMIAEAERLGVKDDGLADLSVLVDGFLQLIRSSADQRPAALPAAAVPVASAAGRPADQSPAGGSRPFEPAPAPSPAAAAARIYSVEDEGVVPPVVIEQRMPAMTVELQAITKASKTSGAIDVVIDENGRVADAAIRQSLNSSFDVLIVRTARNWKYRPATKDGTPVRYRKTLILVP